MALRFPSPTEVSGPVRMRDGGPITPRTDTSGEDIASGVRGLAQSIGIAGENLGQIASRQMEEERVIDLARAEALKTASWLDIQNRVARDNDYGTIEDRYNPEVRNSIGKAAELIRDERLRERWIAQQEEGAVRMVDAVRDRGIAVRDNANRTALEQSLKDNRKILGDPTVPRVVRDKIATDMEGIIQAGEATGLIEPSQSMTLRETYIKGGMNDLAVGIAELDILNDPQRARVGLAIPETGAGGSIFDAQMSVDGGPVPLEFSLAKMTAELIGDANFPDDPAMAQAYLSDPDKAEDYAVAAQAMLTDRYKGDMSAAVIALDPNGGTALADKWVKSGHDEKVLPKSVRDRYRAVMSSLTVEQPYTRIPLAPADGVDLTTTDAGVLGRFEQLQSRFGMALPIISAARDEAHNAEVGGADKSEHLNKRALDVDVSGLNEEQRLKFISMASAMGFTGIGIYENSIHLDTGDLRAWGPDYHRESVPGYAEDIIAKHVAGQVDGVPQLYSGVAPEYADLTFDQRLALFGKAKAALADREVTARASLQTVAENAPAAIARTGAYDGQMPTATDFVQAYGAEEGIQRWNAFDTAVDTSRTIFGMKTMSNEEVLSSMRDATPTQGGNMAALEEKRFAAITEAGNAVLKARADDPAGYVIAAYPNVAAAWEAAQDGKISMSRFMAMSAEAQKSLGITEPAYLPEAAATAAAAAFKDTTKGADERVAAVTGYVLATSDIGQQNAIFTQLVKAGLPSMMSAPLEAMRRGDSGATMSLLRAVLFDPADLKLKLPGDIKDDDIKTELMEQVFAPGGIGDITYGLTGGTMENFQQGADAVDILSRVVKQRLVDGTAGGNLDTAIALAKKDLFGDAQVITEKSGGFSVGAFGFEVGIPRTIGIKATAPADVPADRMRAGFMALSPVVRETLRDMMSVDDLAGTPDAKLAFGLSADNYIDTVMAEGYFTNASGMVAPGEQGYIFYDPNNDAAVTDADGNPLIFSLDDVISAGLNQ